MIRLLRHDDTIHWKDDGAVRFDDREGRSRQSWWFAMASWSLDNFPGKRRGTEEEVSVLLEPLTLPNISVCLSNSRDIQEVLSLIPHCKTLYCCRMTSPSTSTTSGTLSVFHSREPDIRQSRFGRSSIRSGQTQNYSVQKYLESSPKIHKIGAIAQWKRIAVLSNPIARNRSHITFDLY